MLTPRKLSHQLYFISWVLLIAFAIGIIVSPTLKMIESLSMAVSILSIWMLTTVKFYENYRRNLVKSLTEKERKEYMIRELTADYKVSREDAEAILKKTRGAYALQDNLGQDAVSFAKFKHSWEYYMILDDEVKKIRESENVNANMKYSRNGIEIYKIDEKLPFKKTILKTMPKGSIDRREFRAFSK